MSKIYDSVSELIGRTPLVRLHNIEKAFGAQAQIAAKLEYFNPAGSSKDRIAKAIIEDAQKRGILKPGGVIIEPTSGNTGIGLAAVAASLGYEVILTMPDSMSAERRTLLKAYGARLVLTDGKLGMTGAIERACELAREIPGSFIAGQFDNPANPAAHYASTGPEIWEDTDGKADIFVAGVGTGGTFSGTAKYLKEKNPDIKAVAFEPASSPMISEGRSGPHGIQGIGANFVPENFKKELCDEVLTVSDEDALKMGAEICRREGLLVGISSGGCVCAALELAKRPENRGKLIVALLPDSGSRYLSGPMFSQQ